MAVNWHSPEGLNERNLKEMRNEKDDLESSNSIIPAQTFRIKVLEWHTELM